jgi:hypothetical protein
MKKYTVNNPQTTVHSNWWLVILLLLTIHYSLLPTQGFSQTSINTTGAAPASSAMLDVSSNSMGVLVNRMTTAQMNAIHPDANAAGLLIFNTDNNCFMSYVEGAWKSVACPSACMPPSAPTAYTDLGPGKNAFIASWSSSAGATTYYLDVSTNSGFTSFVSGYFNLYLGNVTSYLVQGLNQNTNYWYRVRAASSPTCISLSSAGIPVTTTNSVSCSWQYTYGSANSNEGCNTFQTLDGGFIISGGFISTPAVYLLVAKTDGSGDPSGSGTWCNRYSRVRQIQQNADGTFIMVGNDNPGSNFGTHNYISIATAYANGSLINSKTYLSSVPIYYPNYGFSINQTSDGGYIMTGTTFDNGAKMLLIKFNSALGVTWAKKITIAKNYVNYQYPTYGSNVIESKDNAGNPNGYIVTGSADGSALVMKTNLSGDFATQSNPVPGYLAGCWVKILNQGSAGYIKQTSISGNGEYMIGGPGYHCKMDGTGAVLSSSVYSSGAGSMMTSDGGWIQFGGIGNPADYFLSRQNAGGNVLWTWKYGTNLYDAASSVSETSDGGFIMSGYRQGVEDYYVVKTRPGGFGGCNTNVANNSLIAGSVTTSNPVWFVYPVPSATLTIDINPPAATPSSLSRNPVICNVCY